ncbi:hypothetical protein TSUD_205580 [Trifolium subterraneum]|uniref:Uncharacterized protein n=1 Tax=Trifolium subterraneum TaxID=3900 RepID=A0A2Z6MQ75_TRISU|nr:hypothetical protein TSUD_205580 [Trifolium subterraneum]
MVFFPLRIVYFSGFNVWAGCVRNVYFYGLNVCAGCVASHIQIRLPKINRDLPKISKLPLKVSAEKLKPGDTLSRDKIR